ncbi:hypothetical protein PRZ48_011221 [Zasmidium cellare]|uniref:Uncharacterized protein n=1 Tax=Zasmidium cellare TaxID=395010 RepID=A0ABR0EBY7_ZASCE|nr:hypothetical protein PRZ48_011221 [Zasmidium cellare]
MSFSKIAAIVMLVCSATTGFIIPEGTPDGLYSASIDVDGTEIHTPVANTSNFNEHHIDSRHPHATIDDFASRILPRDSFDVYCGGTRNMNPGDTDYANRELDRQCGTGQELDGNDNESYT